MKVRFLGTTGFVVEAVDGHTIVFDPYVSRPGLFEFLFKTIKIRTEVIDRAIPRADDVLIGHSHIDHILDAPYLCQQTGARLIGSKSTYQVGLAAGLADGQMLVVKERETVTSGAMQCTAIPSEHGRMFGKVPLPGVMESPPNWPPKYNDLLCGEVFDWHIQCDQENTSLMYIDSAEFFSERFEGLQADIVCLCIVGRKWRPNFLTDLVKALNPKVIIPSHWDWMFTEYGQPMKKFPGIGLDQFTTGIRDLGVEPVVLEMDEVYET